MVKLKTIHCVFKQSSYPQLRTRDRQVPQIWRKYLYGGNGNKFFKVLPLSLYIIYNGISAYSNTSIYRRLIHLNRGRLPHINGIEYHMYMKMKCDDYHAEIGLKDCMEIEKYVYRPGYHFL